MRFARHGTRCSMANLLKIFRHRNKNLCLSPSFFFFNRKPMSRETWDAIRICTAHKHTKLKRPEYSDPISFVYLIQALHLSLSLSFFLYMQCCSHSVKNILCTKMRCVLYEKRMYNFTKRGSVALCLACVKCRKSHSRPPRFCIRGGEMVRRKLNV